ncbi:hypothetical protein F2Q69_00047773 [Brassica cretica]|uniref:Uncharacterized protein n=1 Tax=Brassica cretica TaxID=69181 RepID=A0A8S9PTX0_BRACR|nr:hypothetical protein F2Q69_00047773 [Brassica cretica]
MTKRSQRNHNFRQQNNAERLAGVAPGSRSRADFGVSGREDTSDLGVSFQQVALNIGSDFGTSLQGQICVSPDVKTQATSCSRSGKVAPGCGAQRLHVVTPESRSRQCSSKDHSNHLL